MKRVVAKACFVIMIFIYLEVMVEMPPGMQDVHNIEKSRNIKSKIKKRDS